MEKQTLVVSSVGEEGLRGVNCGEGGARKEGEVTAGQSAAKPILCQFAGTRWQLVHVCVLAGAACDQWAGQSGEREGNWP